MGDHTGLPSENKNKAYKSEVKNWKTYRQNLYFEILEATDIVQSGLDDANEFLKYKHLDEPSINQMREQCTDHDKSLDKIKADLFKYKSDNFTKKHLELGDAAKMNVREEFLRLTKYIQALKTVVHAEMHRILEEKDKEEKPAVAQGATAQASGGTAKIEVSYDPMSTYSPLIWKDCKLTDKSTWLEYQDWMRKINRHFNYVEKLSTNDIQRRIIRLHDTMDLSWINHLNQQIQANNVIEWDQVVAILERRMDQIFPKMRRIIAAVTLKQKEGEDLVAFTNRLKIALDSVGYDSWTDDKRKAIDLFQRITYKKLKDKCMEKTKNNVDKLTWDFIMNMDQTLRSGSRDAWEPTGDYGNINKGVPNNKNNSNTNKPTPRVAKAAESAPKQKKDPPKKKKFDPPCKYCVANDIPEPKRSSHQEHKCRFKDGTYKWVPPQTQAAPQAQAQAPRPAGRVDQGTDAAANQEQPTQEQREGAVRDYFDPYLQNSLPDEMTAGASNANRESRISAVRHSTRKRKEEQIEERIAKSEDKEKNESTIKPTKQQNKQ